MLFGGAAVTLAEDQLATVEAGLRFVPDSQKMLDITKIDISYELNMWAHYADPPVEED